MQCPICHLQLQHPTQVQCCRNWFCAPCLNQWTAIKNNCPMCQAQHGDTRINRLAESHQNAEFDNGFLMMDQQMDQINGRIADVSERVRNRRESSRDLRSTFSHSHIMFLEDQVELIRMYQNTMNEKWLLQDRVATVEFMQLITTVIIQIEAAFKDHSRGYEFQDCEEEEQYWDEPEEEYWDDYDEYEEFEMKGMKKLSYKGGRKTKGALIQQEQAPKKGSSKNVKQ